MEEAKLKVVKIILSVGLHRLCVQQINIIKIFCRFLIVKHFNYIDNHLLCLLVTKLQFYITKTTPQIK